MGNQYWQSPGWDKMLALSDNIEMTEEVWGKTVYLILFHVNHLFSKCLSTC
jgi:hypothetical protein